MSSRIAFLGLASAFALAACSGHGGSSIVPQGASSAKPQAGGTARFTLTIPNQASVSSARRAQYIGATTQSASLTVNGGPQVGVDLTAGGPNCTAAVSGRTCTISVAAPIGTNDLFDLTLYNGALSLGQPTGAPLSASVGFAANVAEGVNNVTAPLVLGGVPASATAVVTRQPTKYATSGAASTGSLVLNVYDFDGNLIVGPGTYATAANASTTFLLQLLNNADYKFSVNGGALSTSATIAAPSDQITFAQIAPSTGSTVVVVPQSTTVIATPSFIRPAGFDTTDIELASNTALGSNIQLSKLGSSTAGVNAVAIGLASVPAIFHTDGHVAIASSCGVGLLSARQGDVAYTSGATWTASNVEITFDDGICSANPQFAGALFPVTEWSSNGAVEILDTAGGGCVLSQLVPGVSLNPGTGSPSNCTLPHDLTNNGSSQFAIIEKNSSDTHDHVDIYTNLTFNYDLALTYNSTTAAGGSVESVAGRFDQFFGEDAVNGRLWRVYAPYPGTGRVAASVRDFISLPSGYMYVNNALVSGFAYSNRTLAIGADGLAYALVSSPYDGVVVFDPDTGGVVLQLPNPSGPIQNTTPFNVVSDGRGSIYWSAGTYVLHFPSSASNS